MVENDERNTDSSELFGVRRGMPYTESERRYSVMIEQCMEELLEATRREVVLLRKVYGADRRDTQVSVLPAPVGVDRKGLRPDVVQSMLCATLTFVRANAPGGPVFQRAENGRLVETQMFATRYPHIVIDRVDTFTADGAPLATEWRMRRTQNQKAEVQFNRWLDAADLGFSILKSVTGTS